METYCNIIFIGYIVFPAKKGQQKVNHLPWYDIVLMLLGTGAFMYYAINAKAIIQQGSVYETYQIIIGIIGILFDYGFRKAQERIFW